MNCPYGMSECFEGCKKRCTPQGWDAFMFSVSLSEKQKKGRMNGKRRATPKYGSVYGSKWDGQTRHVSL